MIRRIRIVLRLQTETIAPFVDMTVLAGNSAVKKIPRVELNRRLRGPDFECAAAGGLVNTRRQYQAVLFRLGIEDEIVIITVPKNHLFVRIFDACAHLRGSGEIERCAFDGTKFAGRDQRLVDWSKAIRIDHDFVIQDVATAFARKIEVAVLA
jgi:hypothetical protein